MSVVSEGTSTCKIKKLFSDILLWWADSPTQKEDNPMLCNHAKDICSNKIQGSKTHASFCPSTLHPYLLLPCMRPKRDSEILMHCDITPKLLKGACRWERLLFSYVVLREGKKSCLLVFAGNFLYRLRCCWLVGDLIYGNTTLVTAWLKLVYPSGIFSIYPEKLIPE